MNKDKTIKDLKERNSKLDLQRFQNEVRYNATMKKNEELQQRIDKAIKCIEKLDENKLEIGDNLLILDNYLSDLLDILRGESNE